MIVKSRICAVTVYNDRAEVTRTLSTRLEKGDHILIFDMLPESIDPNSIQVKGGGNAVLNDVKFKSVYFEDLPDPAIKALSDDEQQLTEAIDELEDKIEHAEKEKALVEDIAKRLTSLTEKKAEAFEFNPDKWIRMVEFYRSKHEELDKEIRVTNKEKKIIHNKLEKVLNEISAAGSGAKKRKHQVEVFISTAEDGEIELNLVYMVYGPSWTPLYDLRVASEKKNMSISYRALVQQCTNEDWIDVVLKLSTARPNISGRQPELSPWRIDIHAPQLLRNAMAPASMPAAKTAMRPMHYEDVAESSSFDLPEMTPVQSEVQTGATSVLFAVGGKITIESGDERHRVTILTREFPAYFRYSSVPKLAQYAYLKAKVKNETEYPFLPGESNVFLDNNFVANSSMDLAAPGEEFWTFLGVDEAMKIEHKFLNRYEVTEGIFSKTTKLMYEYLITLKNNKKSEADVVIWDQIPISGNEEIVVKLIAPEYKRESPVLKMDENKHIEWLFTPKPGQEIKIPLTFSVEHPKNVRLTGL